MEWIWNTPNSRHVWWDDATGLPNAETPQGCEARRGTSLTRGQPPPRCCLGVRRRGCGRRKPGQRCAGNTSSLTTRATWSASRSASTSWGWRAWARRRHGDAAAAFLWVLTVVWRRRGTTLASGRTAAPWRSPWWRVACYDRYGRSGCRWAQPQSSTRASGRLARGHLHEAVSRLACPVAVHDECVSEGDPRRLLSHRAWRPAAATLRDDQWPAQDPTRPFKLCGVLGDRTQHLV